MNEHLEKIIKEIWDTWQANGRDQDEVDAAIENVIKNAGEVRRQFDIGEAIRKELQEEVKKLKGELEELKSRAGAGI